MASTVEQRLESWRALLKKGGPAWLVEFAPKAIAELEAEIALRQNTIRTPLNEQ